MKPGRQRERRCRARGLFATPAVLAAALALGFWPVWRWYVARLSDGSDEPLGLAALAAAGFFLPRRGWLAPLGAARLTTIAAVLGVYLAVFGIVPPLIRAGIAVTALALVIPRENRRGLLPVYALMLLSLPVIASLQYFLGFPMRAATTWCSAHVLGLAGFSVEAHGTILRWENQEILIDAPCSGVRMLWTAACLSSVLGAAFRLPAWRFVRLAQATATAVFLANLVRCIVLFFLEAGIWPNPGGAHEGVGVAAFAVVAVVCAMAAEHLRTSAPRAVQTVACDP